MKKIIIETSDGSSSVFLPEYNEHYHSRHGAINESRHVFIDSGLMYIAENTAQINIFELGFGTGLNAYMTWLKAKELNLKINYTSIEAYPLPVEIYDNLNYAQLLATNNEAWYSVFGKLHESNWGEFVNIDQHMSIKKIAGKVETTDLDPGQFNLIYFDAFAPRVQEELWTTKIFQKMYDIMTPESVLVTYCAKGEVKRNLKQTGFIVESLPGPPGKREMVRCLKTVKSNA